ncbi:metallophosphatase family protein [Desulfovibrio sp. OttesenSCG-928-I05]|nr:metallophosphatase family protein [Desulfovibrio sp. OttesenSCG-928-I05]
MPSPVAVISDIHGNSFALKAVLREIQRRNINRVINLGDTFYGPLDIPGTYALLESCSISSVHIRGNGDRMLLAPVDKDKDNATVLYSKKHLTASLRNFLSTTPTVYYDDALYACHGSPHSDMEYLLEEIQHGSGALKKTESVEETLAGIGQKMILCGHSHLARTFFIPARGQLVVNPGSVGLPAYADDLPVPHMMEAGSPLAQFAVITHSSTGWHVEQIQLAYDWQAASALAEKNGRPDWAFALATGRAARP